MLFRNLCRRKLCLAFAVFAILLVLPTGLFAQSGNYSFMNVDYPGAEYTQVSGINDSGHIVGFYFGTDGVVHGFVDTGSGLVTLDYPGSDTTGPAGINNSDEITGYHNDATGTHGFLYSNGVFSSFDCPGAQGQTNPHGINNHGVVVGVCNGAFVYDNGSFSYIAYPNKVDTIAFGINDSGEIAGTYRDSDAGDTHGFLYSAGTYTPLDFPGLIQTYAIGINNAGAVVGYANSYTNSEGFLYRAGQFTPLDPSTPLEAYGISNTGKIVGLYFPSDEHGFIATPVSGAPLQFVPVLPCRLVDTRPPGGGGPIPGGTAESFALPQLGGCNIPATAAAYSLNVTVVPPGRLAFLTIWPTGESQPPVSLMNSFDGRIKANAAIVPAGTNGAVSVYVSNTTNVLIDIDGYFAPPSGQTLQFYPMTPCRVVDTRNPNGSLAGPFLTGDQERDFPMLESSCIPPGAVPVAYSFNVTAVPHPTGQRLGYLTIWPKGLTQPGVSTLNNPTGTTVANAAIVPAGESGEVAVYPNDNTDLLIDMNGYFAAAGNNGLSLYTVTPCRVLDTRGSGGNGAPFMGELPVDVVHSACAPPATAQAYVLNATVVPPGALGFLTLWPNGQNRPNASTLNAQDGAITSNMAIVPTTNGFIDAYASALTQLLLDISSYFAP